MLASRQSTAEFVRSMEDVMESNRRDDFTFPRSAGVRRRLSTVSLVGLLFLAGCGDDRYVREFERERIALALFEEAEQGDYRLVATDEVRDMLGENWNPLLVDTMPKDSYDREHLPGAKSFPFPMEPMEEWFTSEMGGRDQDTFREFLGPDRERTIIFYCGFLECPRSHHAATWARRMGYANVHRYPGGLFAWKGAGLAMANR